MAKLKKLRNWSSSIECLVNHSANCDEGEKQKWLPEQILSLILISLFISWIINHLASLSESSSSAKIVSCLPPEMAAAGVLSVNDILIFVYDDDCHRSQVVLCAKSAMSESHRHRWQSGAATFFPPSYSAVRSSSRNRKQVAASLARRPVSYAFSPFNVSIQLLCFNVFTDCALSF
jgi:hypothetical protein